MKQRMTTLVGLFILLVAVLAIPLLQAGDRFGVQSVRAQSCPPDVVAGCVVTGAINGTNVWTAVNTSTSGISRGLEGRTQSPDGNGVRGVASSLTGTNTGVQGEANSPDGRGVRGIAFASTSNNVSGIGVLGLSNGQGTNAIGVFGNAPSTVYPSTSIRALAQGPTGRALLAETSSTAANAGPISAVEARVSGPEDIAVNVTATFLNGSSEGIRSTLFSRFGAAVSAYAVNTSSSGFAYGIDAQADSPDAVAVHGLAPGIATPGFLPTGGLFQSNGNNGHGVIGLAPLQQFGIGVFGGSPIDVGYAGYFDGDVVVDDELFVNGVKNFRIDHPNDPTNKYLKHASVESSEVLNVYSGNATTDDSGKVEVKLPDYFEAINRDFRYQLTVVGQFAQAIVDSEIKDNHFTIATDKPMVKVSWQVTGVRNDAYMQTHPWQAEVDKLEVERGTYLSPEAYGQPASAKTFSDNVNKMRSRGGPPKTPPPMPTPVAIPEEPMEYPTK